MFRVSLVRFEPVFSSGANTTILRIGQIVLGRHRSAKLWNPTEADTLADTTLELASTESLTNTDGPGPQLVNNIANPRLFSWKSDLLPALQRTGIEFDIVS
jgi:hypothetical protein